MNSVTPALQVKRSSLLAAVVLEDVVEPGERLSVAVMRSTADSIVIAVRSSTANSSPPTRATNGPVAGVLDQALRQAQQHAVADLVAVRVVDAS